MALLRLAASAYIAVICCLLGLVGACSLLLGWEPVVVSSPSAVDHLNRGDVVLVSPSAIDPAQVTIAAVDHGNQRVIRRVHSLGSAGMIATIDGRPLDAGSVVTEEELVGVARLVVPALGLPLVWPADGNPLIITAWLVTTAAATALAISGLARSGSRPIDRTGATGSRPFVVPLAGSRPLVDGADRIASGLRLVARRPLVDGADRIASGLRLAGSGPFVAGADRIASGLRAGLALTVIAQYLADGGTVAEAGRTGVRALLVAISVSTLAATIVVSRRQWARRTQVSRSAALVVSVLVAATAAVGTAGLSWLILVLPVAEALLMFGPSTAVATWVVLSALALVGRLALLSRVEPQLGLGELDRLVGETGMVLLVLLAVSVVVDRLVTELADGQQRLEAAHERGRLLECVAKAGSELAAADTLPLAAIVRRARELGFDRADVVESTTGVDWVELAAGGDRSLPPPGARGSGLRRRDQLSGLSVVAGDDPDPEERHALAGHGLSLVLAHTISKRLGRTVVLRAAIEVEHSFNADIVELFRLLAGEVSLAASNDDLVGELQTLRDRQHRLVLQDPVTGLASHEGLVQDLTIELLDGDAAPVIIVWAPDDFEQVYNRLGREPGDALLQLVARRIERVAGAHCSAARLAHQEFALMIPGSPAEDVVADVVRRMERIAHEPFEVRGELVHLAASVGVAVGQPGTDPSELIRRADVALRESKASRAADRSHEMYRPTFERDRARRSALARALPVAIASSETGEGGLHVEYQPIRRLSGRNSIVGFEALLRWRQEIHGEIPSPEILEVAQTAGRRGELSRFIVDRVVGDAASWARQFPTLPFFVSINVSPSEIVSTELIDALSHALDLTGLDPSHLVVEVAGDLVSDGGEPARSNLAVLSNLDGLSELGIGILVAGFGSGLSSPTDLPEVALSGLKLDRQLVSHAARRALDRGVVESIVEMGRLLDLAVIAQGIETRHHLETVVGLGCTIGQGHFLGHPVAPAQVVDLLGDEHVRLVEVLARPVIGDET